MKKLCCYIIVCILSVCLLFSGCKSASVPSDVSATPNSTSSIKTDDSVWYSEEAGVRGRIWLGMTEKEVYDVLNNYNVTITQASPGLELDEYGAAYEPPESYYKKRLYTEGHQSFWFDKEDRLVEIMYFDQMHHTSSPINEEFEAQRGVQRGDYYEDMIKAYGDPDEVINAGNNESNTHSYVYRLENGDYLHFVYQGASLPLQSIHYCEYPCVFSYY